MTNNVFDFRDSIYNKVVTLDETKDFARGVVRFFASLRMTIKERKGYHPEFTLNAVKDLAKGFTCQVERFFTQPALRYEGFRMII